jgi:lysyl-tRNA synthetase class 2
MTGRFLRIELHELGPRAWLLGRRVVSWRLGVHRRVRALRAARRADWLPGVLAIGTAVVGLVNVASALTRNPHWRTHVLEHARLVHLVPVFHTLALPAGALLVVLALYIAKRRRRAWAASVCLLVALGLVNLLKGLDFEEAILGWALAALLWWGRDAFHVRHEPATLRSALWRVPLIAIGTVSVSVLAIWAGSPDGAGPSSVWHAAISGLLLQPSPLHFRDDFTWVPVAVQLVSVAAALAAAYLVFRPIAAPRDLPDRPIRHAAADLIRAHGTDSLAAFKLRHDLQYLFAADGHAFAGYRVHAGVMLLAGDPVGTPESLPALLRDVVAFAEARGLKVAVIGAGDPLLSLYEQAGLRAFYIGDEAIVETQRFTLEGRAIRKVRQAVRRVARAGYSAELKTVDELDAATLAELEAVSSAWRRGQPERGFSMTLDSLDGEDLRDSVVVVARDAENRARAFLHFVPVCGRSAMSLSFMRWERNTPNGLSEYLVVKSIELLKDRSRELSLNFAAFARVIHSPECRRDRVLGRIAAWFNPFFQIESLYRFNAKFSPRWEPRYLVYEGATGLARAGLAAMRAEGQLPRLRR